MNWNLYFSRIVGTELSFCNACGTQVPRKRGNTAGLKQHLRKYHNEEFKKLFGTNNEPYSRNVKCELSSELDVAYSEWNSAAIAIFETNRAITQMICTSQLPFSIVENEGFVNLLKILVPGFLPCSGKAIMTSMFPDLYIEYKKKLQARIDRAAYVSFTTDSWISDCNSHSLLSLTAHFWDGNKLVQRILGVKTINGHYDASTLFHLFDVCVAEYFKDVKKVHLILQNAAAVMNLNVKCFEAPSVECFAHTLQLAVDAGFKAVGKVPTKALIEKVKKFVRKIRKRISDKTEFEALEQIHPRWLNKGTEMRWSPLYDLLLRFFENKEALIGFCSRHSDYPSFNIAEFCEIKTIIDSLRPVWNATIMLRGQNATIAAVLPTIYVLRRELRKNCPNILFKQAIINDFESRIAGVEELDVFLLATVLDPRFKLDFMEAEYREKVVDRLRCAAEKLITDFAFESETSSREEVQDVSASVSQEMGCFELYRNSQLPSSPGNQTFLDECLLIKDEIAEYLKQNARSDIDPIDYWTSQMMVSTFKYLSRLASRYLSAPATSVESERLYSTEMLALNDLRNSMTLADIERLLFLKYNIPLEGF